MRNRNRKRTCISQDDLKRILRYDPDTGEFFWNVARGGGVQKDSPAGYIDDGYVVISINDAPYYAHRLAWLYVYGYLPENRIDHKDKTRNHNWISNLREVSQVCNLRNTGNREDNTSGVKGVYWFRRDSKWQAQIVILGEKRHLGYFDEFDDAVCARLAAEQCVNWSGCDSSSPAYQYVKNNILAR